MEGSLDASAAGCVIGYVAASGSSIWVQVGRGRTGTVLYAEQHCWDGASGASDRVPGNTGRTRLPGHDAVQCSAFSQASSVAVAVAVAVAVVVVE